MSVEGNSCENSPENLTGIRPDPEHQLVFLAYDGGPLYQMQRRVSILCDSALMAGQRTRVFVSPARLGPLSLSSTLSPEARSFIMDPGAWAKFLIALSTFVLAEQQVELGLRLEQFVKAPLIAPILLPAAANALATALRRRNSTIAEGCNER